MLEAARGHLVTRQARLFEQAPGFIIIMGGPAHIVEFVNDAHRSAFNSAGWIGKPIREAFPSIEGQGFFESLDEVYRSGKTFEAHGTEVRYRRTPDGPEEVRYLSFMYAPLYDNAGSISGIFCEGFDVTDAHRATRRMAALARLGDRIREIEDPDELAFAAAEILGVNSASAGPATAISTSPGRPFRSSATGTRRASPVWPVSCTSGTTAPTSTT